MSIQARPASVARVEQLVGDAPRSWTEVATRGYAVGERWRIALVNGRSLFVKVGITPSIAANLRAELRVYEHLQAPFLPRLIAWDESDVPLLVLEDLSDAHWPPPWRPGDVAAVVSTMELVAAAPPPPGLAPLEDADITGWAEVAQAPESFLRLGVASEVWLEHALPILIAAERETPLRGERLVHADLRSDNLCLRDDRAVLVDWNWASIGNPDFDLAFWLPSLVLEGGATIEDVAVLRPGLDRFAAHVAGFFACRAGLEPPAEAPTVRDFQLAQLGVALPWAVRVLHLAPPGGIGRA